jgi:hypothetical protein
VISAALDISAPIDFATVFQPGYNGASTTLRAVESAEILRLRAGGQPISFNREAVLLASRSAPGPAQFIYFVIQDMRDGQTWMLAPESCCTARGITEI